MKLDKKLEHFYQSVIDDATTQSECILKEYEASLKQKYEEAKIDIKRKADLTLKVETDNIIREKNKILSTEALDIKRQLNCKDNELKERLFTDVYNKLVEFMKTPEYTDLLVREIKEAVTFSRGEAMTLYINASDADKKSYLEEKTGATLTISTTDFLGGTRAVIHDKHILINNSFITKLAEEKDIFQF